MSHLLHPELFAAIPGAGAHVAGRFESMAAAAAAEHHPDHIEPDITVGIRTLNEAGRLALLLADIAAQDYSGNVDVVVVDNESTDDTAAVANDFGAQVVNLPRGEFTYPRSMNLAMEHAPSDLVFLTVGHALLSTTQTFRASARPFAQAPRPFAQAHGSRVGGAYGVTLPGANISRTERLLALGTPFMLQPREVRKSGLGVMAAQNAVFSKAVWRALGGFDEAYQTGGEDTALAGAMLEEGYKVVYDPLLAVHHTHGLGPLNTLRQWNMWGKTLRAPQELDRAALAQRRPDLNL